MFITHENYNRNYKGWFVVYAGHVAQLSFKLKKYQWILDSCGTCDILGRNLYKNRADAEKELEKEKAAIAKELAKKDNSSLDLGGFSEDAGIYGWDLD